MLISFSALQFNSFSFLDGCKPRPAYNAPNFSPQFHSVLRQSQAENFFPIILNIKV